MECEVCVFWSRELEKEQDDDERNYADGKVDVEAPSPGHFVCEGTAEQRANDGSDSEGCAEESRVYGPFVERDCVKYSHQAPREDASRSKPSNRTADDEGYGIRSSSAEG